MCDLFFRLCIDIFDHAYHIINDGILIGEIVNVSADDSVITDGNVDPKKLKPIIFDPCNNAYWGFGNKAGNAFRDGAILK